MGDQNLWGRKRGGERGKMTARCAEEGGKEPKGRA